MSDTPTFEQLVDLAEGRLAGREREQVEARLAADPDTAALAAWVAKVLGIMRSDEASDAPEHLVNRAIRLLRPAPAPPLLRRLLAGLRFDSAAQPLVAGLRSDQAAPRQLLFAADDRDLDVRITGAGGLHQLAGQVLGPDDGGSIELIGESLLVRAELNQLSEFTLPPVAAGRYRLLLRQGQLEIETHTFELG